MASARPEGPANLQTVYRWMDRRADLSMLWKELFARKVPIGVGWLYTLGFATLFVFILQATTGVFLAMYYSASPDHAYDSIQYIMNDVTFGSFIRGIHHWGASAMVVLAALHAATVFFLGSYKYPRELTWILGVFLLLITLGFGFTGYLLPWDQKSYWATQVGTNMAGTVPFAGDYALRVVRGGTDLGAVTLSRFFAIHTMLLPATLMMFVAAHLYLVIKLGVSVPPQLWDKRNEPKVKKAEPTNPEGKQ